MEMVIAKPCLAELKFVGMEFPLFEMLRHHESKSTLVTESRPWMDVTFNIYLKRRKVDSPRDSDLWYHIQVYPKAMDGTWRIDFDVDLSVVFKTDGEITYSNELSATYSANFRNSYFEMPIIRFPEQLIGSTLEPKCVIKIRGHSGFQELTIRRSYTELEPFDDMVIDIRRQLIYAKRIHLAANSVFFRLAVQDKEPEPNTKMYYVDLSSHDIRHDEFVALLQLLEGRHNESSNPIVKDADMLARLFRFSEEYGMDKVKMKLNAFLMMDFPYKIQGLTFSKIIYLAYKHRNSSSCTKVVRRLERMGELERLLFETTDFMLIEGRFKSNLEQLRQKWKDAEPKMLEVNRNWAGFAQSMAVLSSSIKSERLLYPDNQKMAKRVENTIAVLNTIRRAGPSRFDELRRVSADPTIIAHMASQFFMLPIESVTLSTVRHDALSLFCIEMTIRRRKELFPDWDDQGV